MPCVSVEASQASGDPSLIGAASNGPQRPNRPAISVKPGRGVWRLKEFNIFNKHHMKHYTTSTAVNREIQAMNEQLTTIYPPQARDKALKQG